MIDTHTHLYMSDYAGDQNGAETVRRAVAAGVEKMIFPNVDCSSIAPMRALAEQFPGVAYMAMGLHPTEVGQDWESALACVIDEMDSHASDYVAIGEIGGDLYWDKTYAEQQMIVLDTQVRKAAAADKPIIIHCREALPQVLEVLKGVAGVRGVFHSFGGTVEDVRKIREVGDFYFGINGIVTFKNCQVKAAIPEITLDRLVLETDAPWLAPVPMRGKRNESAYMVNTAQYIADYMDMPLSEIDRITTGNACRLFKI